MEAAIGKTNRKEVLRVFENFDNTCESILKYVKDPFFTPRNDDPATIIDGANNKPREIRKPRFFPEQIMHHLIMRPFKTILTNGLYENVYGCIPASTIIADGKVIGKKDYGLHSAHKVLKKWLRCGKKLFVCEADVHHAYQSVHIATLVKKLERVIKDEKYLELLWKFIGYDRDDPNIDIEFGLPLGHFTSPWLFNFYMKDFDHFAASIPEIKYLRFADNIFLVGTNKRKVHKALHAITAYLKEKLQLTLNDSTQVFRFEYYNKKLGKYCGRFVNALGLNIHCNRVCLRKSIIYRARRRAVRISKKEILNWYDSASFLSRLGWFKRTNTRKYFAKYIKPFINIKKMKQKVKEYNNIMDPKYKLRKGVINGFLENSTWFEYYHAA